MPIFVIFIIDFSAGLSFNNKVSFARFYRMLTSAWHGRETAGLGSVFLKIFPQATHRSSAQGM
jgi:hypothetical protein